MNNETETSASEDAFVSKYNLPAGSDFDLQKWYGDFFLEEDDSVMNYMTAQDFITLCLLDAQLLQKNRASYTDISDACRGLGGMMMLIRMRTLRMDFQCTEGVCAFIAQLCGTPGKAVMWCHALALAWERREPSMILPVYCSTLNTYTDIPDMNWIANMFNSGFLCGSKDPKGPQWIEADMWGIPSTEHLAKMWDAQKVRTSGASLVGSDNWLDHVITTIS